MRLAAAQSRISGRRVRVARPRMPSLTPSTSPKVHLDSIVPAFLHIRFTFLGIILQVHASILGYCSLPWKALGNDPRTHISSSDIIVSFEQPLSQNQGYLLPKGHGIAYTPLSCDRLTNACMLYPFATLIKCLHIVSTILPFPLTTLSIFHHRHPRSHPRRHATNLDPSGNFTCPQPRLSYSNHDRVARRHHSRDGLPQKRCSPRSFNLVFEYNGLMSMARLPGLAS